MPQFADNFVHVREMPGGGYGFFVGPGLGFDLRTGYLQRKLSKSGPLYTDESGEESVRVGAGMRIATGSPPSIVALPAQAGAIQSDAVAGAANVLDGLRRLAALILAAQGDIDTAQTDIGALNSLISAIVSSPIAAKGTAQLTAGFVQVRDAAILSTHLIFLSAQGTSASPGFLYSANLIDGQFDLNSTDGADDALVAWMAVSL